MKKIASSLVGLTLFIAFRGSSQNIAASSSDLPFGFMTYSINRNLYPNFSMLGNPSTIAETATSREEIQVAAEECNTIVKTIKKNYFAVERSEDAIDFMQVGIVITGGASPEAHNYDESNADNNNWVSYYRISNIDNPDSAQVMHLKWMKIEDRGNCEIVAYPNAIGTDLNIRLKQNTLYKLTIYAPDERVFSEQVLADEKGIVKPGIAHLADGVYFIRIDSGDAIFSILFLKK